LVNDTDRAYEVLTAVVNVWRQLLPELDSWDGLKRLEAWAKELAAE